MNRGRPHLRLALLLASTLACSRPAPGWIHDPPPDAATPNEPRDAIDAGAMRPQLDGQAFPDGVLALTWDDGPDAHTLELAKYLKAQKIRATFFVVQAWRPTISNDPGSGARGVNVFASGYADLPILRELVALGHRLGNHTLNHVILPDAGRPLIRAQLAENQRALDPFQTNGLHLFRVPGGAWDATASSVVDGDPDLRSLTGPIRWDVDRKDWDNSLSCDSTAPELECEPLSPRQDGSDAGAEGGSAPELRTKAGVIAKRYLASIDEAKHGIVLLHDRVGDVGSTYALDLAHVLIPALEARGYVFAAPLLAFSPIAAHAKVVADAGATPPSFADVGAGAHAAIAGADLVRSGDINGDGRVDVCGRVTDVVRCALGTSHGFARDSAWTGSGDSMAVRAAADFALADVNADGRDDICTKEGDASTVSCGLAP